MKAWRRSKAMWLATAVELLGAAELLMVQFQAQIPVWVHGLGLIVIGAAIRIVRIHTTEPVARPGRKGPSDGTEQGS